MLGGRGGVVADNCLSVLQYLPDGKGGSGQRPEHHRAEGSGSGQNSKLVILATERASVATTHKLYKKEHSGKTRVPNKQFNQAVATPIFQCAVFLTASATRRQDISQSHWAG